MRPIDGDALLTILEGEREYHEKNGLQIRADGVMDAIMDVISAPTIQPEIIHCKDCKHWKEFIHQCGVQVCSEMYGDDYCSYAERREDDERRSNQRNGAHEGAWLV